MIKPIDDLVRNPDINFGKRAGKDKIANTRTAFLIATSTVSSRLITLSVIRSKHHNKDP